MTSVWSQYASAFGVCSEKVKAVGKSLKEALISLPNSAQNQRGSKELQRIHSKVTPFENDWEKVEQVDKKENRKSKVRVSQESSEKRKKTASPEPKEHEKGKIKAAEQFHIARKQISEAEKEKLKKIQEAEKVKRQLEKELREVESALEELKYGTIKRTLEPVIKNPRGRSGNTVSSQALQPVAAADAEIHQKEDSKGLKPSEDVKEFIKRMNKQKQDWENEKLEMEKKRNERILKKMKEMQEKDELRVMKAEKREEHQKRLAEVRRRQEEREKIQRETNELIKKVKEKEELEKRRREEWVQKNQKQVEEVEVKLKEKRKEKFRPFERGELNEAQRQYEEQRQHRDALKMSKFLSEKRKFEMMRPPKYDSVFRKRVLAHDAQAKSQPVLRAQRIRELKERQVKYADIVEGIDKEMDNESRVKLGNKEGVKKESEKELKTKQNRKEEEDEENPKEEEEDDEENPKEEDEDDDENYDEGVDLMDSDID